MGDIAKILIASLLGLFGGGGVGQGTLVRVDATVRGGVVELVHATQPWINDANRVWSGDTIRRYNRGITRWPSSWAQTSIQFDAQCTNIVYSDMEFPVIVDGTQVATVTSVGDRLIHTYTVSITPAGGGSTVEVWDPWGANPSTQNTGSDIQVEGCYVVGVHLPPGMSTVPHPTATRAIISLGDSIIGAREPIAANAPMATYGVAGKLRLLAEAKGWLFATLDYGGATAGDGLNAANYVTWIQETVAALGNPATVTVWIQTGHNDWGDYGASVSTTPTQLATLESTIASSLSSYSFVISTPPPATSSGGNAGGFTLADYGTAQLAITGSNVTAKIDSSTCGIVPASDLGDGVHFNDSGVAKDVTCIRGSLGL